MIVHLSLSLSLFGWGEGGRIPAGAPVAGQRIYIFLVSFSESVTVGLILIVGVCILSCVYQLNIRTAPYATNSTVQTGLKFEPNKYTWRWGGGKICEGEIQIVYD
jgi:hypothetical protein